jgi:hypothetical protein
MTRRRVAIVLLLLLLEVLVFGCQGWGKPAAVGSHRFQAIVDGSSVAVFDPPVFGAILGLTGTDTVAGQFSPDGQWLYLVYGAGGSSSIAAVSAHAEGDLIRVDLRVKAECQLSCAAFESVAATRVRLAPAVDPRGLPRVQVNGQPIAIEAWMP